MSTATVTRREPGPPDERGPLEMPELVSRYRPLERLGAGGMGVVYSAWDPALRRKIAIKLMRPRMGRPDMVRAACERALREARALAHLSHPNVVEVFDCGVHEGRVFLALELVAGGSLDDWLDAHPRTSPADVVAMFVAAGRGLAAAHAHGIIHRDFKAANVLVDEAGRARVTDFGIARIEDLGPRSTDAVHVVHNESSDSDPLTQAGAIVGTRGYIPPELFEGQAADARSDQFSFCCALWKALYGELPFSRHAFDHPELRDKAPPSPPRDARVPRPVIQVMLRGLSMRRDDRFPTMEALLDALTPAPRRRSAVWWAALGVPVLAVGWMVAQPDRTGCTARDSGFAEIWTEARRSSLAARFAATRRAYADDAWSSVASRLEDWTARWASARADTCADPSARGFDRRMECLRARRDELATFLDALADPTATTLAQAPLAAAELGDPAGCLAEDGAPSSNAPAGASTAVALAELGRFEDARAQAMLLRSRADDDATRAASAIALGRVHELAGTYDAAEAELADAYWTASAAGDDAHMLAAATALVRVVGTRLRRHADAEEWIRHARAALQRHSASALARAELGQEEAALHLASGRLSEAVEGYEAALNLLEALSPAQPLRLARVQTRLGFALERLQRYDEARGHLTDALAIYERELGPAHPARARPLEGIAKLQRQAGELDAAEATLREVLELQRSRVGEQHPDVAETFNLLADVAHARGDLEAAQTLLRRALAIRRATLDPDHADIAAALTNLGRVSAAREDYAGAARHYREALALLEPQWREDHPRLALPLLGLGNALVASGRLDEAVPVLERALRVAGGEEGDPKVINSVRRALGFALYELDRDRTRAADLLRRARDDTDDPEIRAGLSAWLAERGL